MNRLTQYKTEERESWVFEEIRKHGSYDPYTESGYSKIFDMTFKKFEIKPPARILDVGCGSGSFAQRLTTKGFRVIGIDLSVPSLLLSFRGNNVSYCAADAEYLPFADGAFEASICIGLLHHFCDFAKVISEMKRVTEEGGFIFAIEPNKLNFHIYFAMERNSPVRYEKLTKNERSIPPREIKHKFEKIGLSAEIDYLYLTSALRKNYGFLGQIIIYKCFGFILKNISTWPKRILAFFLFHLIHFIIIFLPKKYRANYLVASARNL